MRTRLNRITLNVCLVVAVMSAAISPACAFISGRGGDWIEICSGLDNKIINIRSDKQSTPPEIVTKGCSFCFQNLNMAGIIDHPLVVKIEPLPLFYNGFYTRSALIKDIEAKQPRGPPSLSSFI